MTALRTTAEIGRELGGQPQGPPGQAAYDVLGVTLIVRSSVPEPIDVIDRSYRAFRIDDALPGSSVIDVLPDPTMPGRWQVSGGGMEPRTVPSTEIAAIDAMERLVHSVMGGLHASGRSAVHASAAVHRGRSVILSGPSGSGKTTLVLALARQGMGLLSDELAVLDRDGLMVHPFPRGLHLRPGTPERIPGFESLLDQRREQLGGGIAWAIAHDELGGAFGISVADAAPLGAVVLLDGHGAEEPHIEALRPGIAALELLRGTWAASVDFSGSLRRIGALTGAVPCIRLRAADPGSTARRLIAWLDEIHDSHS